MTHKIASIFGYLLIAGIAACTPISATLLPVTEPASPSATALPTITLTLVPSPTSTPVPTSTVRPLVPDFKHIIMIVFENHEFDTVIGNQTMPNYNRYANGNTLLTKYFAITHPSLPNYLALFGGDTFGISSDCEKCFISASNLADQIEASGRTWRAYFQDMPQPCFVSDTAIYVQKHNPFMYFDSIRLDATRCNRSVVPFPQLEKDLAAGSLPDFVYIMPNSCVSTDDIYSNPDCNLSLADGWLGGVMGMLLDYLNPRTTNEPYLIILTWDEGQGNHSCCGLPAQAGGRVPTILISPLVKSGFQDSTPYTHYSLLKTVETAWGLSFLAHAANEDNVLITAAWK